MPKQMLMMEPGDEFLTMDTVSHKGQVKQWKVLPDGRIALESPVYRTTDGQRQTWERNRQETEERYRAATRSGEDDGRGDS